MTIPFSLWIFIGLIAFVLGLSTWSFRARLLSWEDLRSMLICSFAIMVMLPSVPWATIPQEDTGEGEVSAQEAQAVAEQLKMSQTTDDPKPKTWYQLAKTGQFPRITILDGDTSTEFQVQTITSTTTSIVPIGQYIPDTAQMENNPPLKDPTPVPSTRMRR